MEWFRLIILAFVLLATVVMAFGGFILAAWHVVVRPNQGAVSTIKVGKAFEFSSDVVGGIVMALALVFFYLAGTWFRQERGPAGNEIRDFLAKTSGEHVPRSQLLQYITKQR